MYGWLGVVEVLAGLVLLVLLCLVLLAVRQRWLARAGGTFECSLRLRTTTPGAGWALGVARYDQGSMRWFRFFSYSLRPRLVLPRGEVRVLESRDPDPVEAVSLSADQLVVRIQLTRAGDAPAWELAMTQESLTGMLSWLEAAPPGLANVS